MKYNVDIKSIVIGFLSAALLISTISFKNNSEEKSGKYQTATGKEEIVILDTQTAAYIIAPFISDVGKVQWIKGDFNSTYQVSKDNKKVSK